MMRRRRLVVAGVVTVLAAAALVVAGARTAERLADRQARAARALLADARGSSTPQARTPAWDPGRSSPHAARARPGVEEEVAVLANAERARVGAAAVGRDRCMDTAASSSARRMAETGRMAHDPEAEAAVRACRGSRAAWGDNVGHWQPCSAVEMHQWWMGSPSHRPHVLDGGFAAVGVGVWEDSGGRCWFQVLFGS